MRLLVTSLLFMLLAVGRTMAAPPKSPTSHVMQRSEQTERGFIKSCYDVRFFNPRVINFKKYKKTSPYVVARCLTPDADKCSWMPPFACFANTDGAITYARDGFFDKSCSACEYRAALGKMKCRCDSEWGVVDAVVKIGKDACLPATVDNHRHKTPPRLTDRPAEDYLWVEQGSLMCHDYTAFPIPCAEEEMTKIRFMTGQV
ncbi:Putative Cyanovirin-N superfamily [Colletotrichum destructivum]|uniref:Cyanovirin-N superfamily n=1 Tax=Colletotrichum destructivum TaxID=34406 RepID=A0AAX4IFP9_9PEZI|nr:Putative Cyanovirin-N superfamily [Colletotrichum destructivum]